MVTFSMMLNLSDFFSLLNKITPQDLVLSPDTDEFYAANMFLDFGDLGVAVKALLDSYQAQLKDKQNIQSIDDIKRFLDSYPQLSKVKNTISTHVTIMEKLSKIVQQRDLMTLGEIEQQIVCHSTEAEARKNVLEQIRRPEIEQQDKLRLSCIYALRFGDAKLSEIVNALTLAGLSTSDIAVSFFHHILSRFLFKQLFHFFHQNLSFLSTKNTFSIFYSNRRLFVAKIPVSFIIKNIFLIRF